MARLATTGASAPDPTSINLARLLTRMQETLLKSDSTTERRLRTSPYERSKVGVNLEYARNLLLRLEQDSAAIKIQTKKQEVQLDLLQKRDVITKLTDRLAELSELSQDDVDGDDSEGEDLLGEETPSDTTEDRDVPPQHTPEEPELFKPLIDGFPISVAPPSTTTDREELFPSELRSRHAQASNTATDTAQTTSSETAPVSGIQEKMLSHNRAEQENLTDSLLSMAQALRASSLAFAQSLESEKDILEQTGSGLEKNTSGMEAAQKRIGLLKKMSEGQGWWGRMMLYAWIFGLMFLAFFIVAFMPKLRF